jgi:hypothetical protein
MTSSSPKVLRQPIPGFRRFSNYLFATVITIGGVGFFLASLSSFFQVNLLLFTDATQLYFRPQGLVMGFYGTAALALASFLWGSIWLDVGGGYNEFNQETSKITIFRWGFPGKNRQVELVYDFDQIQAIRIDVKDGVNPKRVLYLKIRGKGEIPLTRAGQPIALATLENQGAEFARIVGVPLEGL